MKKIAKVAPFGDKYLTQVDAWSLKKALDGVASGTELGLYTGQGDWLISDGDLPCSREEMGKMDYERLRVHSWMRYGEIEKKIELVRNAGCVPVLVSCTCCCEFPAKEIAAKELGIRLTTRKSWSEEGGIMNVRKD